MLSGSTPLGRPPRPVADCPALVGEALAKAWLLELVALAPLQASAALPVADLVAGGPALCVAVLAAVSSDGGLQRLQSDERAARAGALAGAGDPAGIVAAVEALRAAAWRELTAELAPAADPGLVADLGHRLAHVCSVVAQAALTRPRSPTRCALLVLEVDDVERLLSAEPEGALAQELQEAEHELTAVLRPGDRLTREQAGRWSVIAPDADPASARELAERLSRAFAACAPARHGVRLTLSIGLAVAADAGAELADLEAEAQVGLFAARAAGRPLA